jgi:hypothetical protein
MQDTTARTTQMATSTTNALYKALQAIRESGLDCRTEVSLTAALIANYHRWLSGQASQSIYEAKQVAPSASALYKALQAIRNSGLDSWIEVSLICNLVASYYRWLSRQPIRCAASEWPK